MLANDVILAIPPSVWSGIRVSDRRLAALLRRAPAMGHTVKYLMRFDRRFWQDFNSGPTLTEDGPVD